MVGRESIGVGVWIGGGGGGECGVVTGESGGGWNSLRRNCMITEVKARAQLVWAEKTAVAVKT